jgi:TatD DNase family protein
MRTSTRAIADANEGVYAALGIDPHQAASAEARRLSELRELLGHRKAIAVGETGLDNARRFATPREQRALLDAQLEIAHELELPVVIHSRDAARETADALAGFDGTVVLHCFSSPELLPDALERGYYVSFAGNVTYPKASELRDAAVEVPGDRILVETDSPYLSPQAVRGRTNEPAHLVHTLDLLARVRGERVDDLAVRTHENATAAFRL